MNKKSNPLILIPARMGATRLPNKPMAMIADKPMIQHVYERAVKANIGPVYVATPDQAIMDAVEKFGGQAVMTSIEHQSGSDRIFEAANKVDPDQKFDVIVNLQGDLPLISPEALQAVLLPLDCAAVDIATIASPIRDMTELNNPNVVKIALELDTQNPKLGKGLYFSRSLIPVQQNPDDVCYHHIGVYAFRRAALSRFMTLPQSLLERREKLEQLRALACGMRIDVALVDAIPQSVDTAEDLEKVRKSA